MRFDGPIPKLESEKYPRAILVIDTEATRGGFVDGVETQVLRLGVSRYVKLSDELEIERNVYDRFVTGEGLLEIIEWHTRKDQSLYIYAHNLKYDLQLTGLLPMLLASGWRVSLMVMQDPPTFIRLKSRRKSILLVDTFNYWQTSLARLGEQLSSAKAKMPEGEQSDDDWYKYCEQDVKVLSEYLLEFMRFLQREQLAGFGLTLASQAFRSYRHRFMHQEIVLHSRPEVLKLERDGYSGGRVEAWHIGEKNGSEYYKVDVNSMYPFVMEAEKYPVEFISRTENICLVHLKKLLERYYCIARVQLKTEEAVYPYKDTHKLLFPTGSFETTLHQRELEYAYDHRQIATVNEIAVYRQADVFGVFVRYMYELKLRGELENNPILRHQAKILLNSLYGKFGQREIISKIIDNPGQPKFGRVTGYSQALGTDVEITYLGEQMEIRYKGGESAYSFPAIAGAVTAYARMYLWSLIQQAGLENTLYCDTDSLIVTKSGMERLSDKMNVSSLGALKLEGQADQLIIRGAKDYIFGDETKHKGVPKNACEISPGVWEYDQFRGATTWLNAGLPIGVEVYKRTKSRKTDYDKGVILENGAVVPLTIDDRGRGA